MNRRKALPIVAAVLIGCACMALVDGVLRPGYLVKSAVKIVLFLGTPLLCAHFDREIDLRRLFRVSRKGVAAAIGAGAAVYAVVLLAYLLARNVFDFSALTKNLTAQTGVTRENFLFVALYISFVNSLLEEFFFRGFAFLTLEPKAGRGFAYGFSALAFALYHLAMMQGWFSAWVALLALVGLALGGVIFNRFDERFDSIYLSWLIHMFANFATNTIGFLLFAT
ncbi:MAG: CPBP family intramembrane metalloprotease [Oscillospiraceae bacterium]|nr:CPBP family intramembrane metalloprotease [Oscillospiraceae bacterium]